MSPKQVTANRRNAQKSTGPKTQEGRAVSRMNAVKHGILSKEVLVRGMYIKESGREFAALHKRFWETMMPVGPMEEMLVDQIVTTHWRLRRALKAESGEIALSVDEGRWKRTQRNPSLTWFEWEAFGDPVHSMRNSVFGNYILEHRLKEVRAAVERDGELTEAAIQGIVDWFGGKPNSLSKELTKLRSQCQQNPDGLEALALHAKNKQQVLDYVDRELRLLSLRNSECHEHEEKEEAARQAAAVLPSLAVLDKIMRYETKLERQLYRAMSQLERLQRMRQGENVPPPLTMEVSERP